MANNQNRNIFNNNNKKDDLPVPTLEETLASWSIWLGVLGFVGNCLCSPIWDLPAGLFIGLAGIVCAVLSKKGKPFTDQAKLGLILSIVATACGFLMAVATIFTLHIMASDSPLGEYARQIWDMMETQREALINTMPTK